MVPLEVRGTASFLPFHANYAETKAGRAVPAAFPRQRVLHPAGLGGSPSGMRTACRLLLLNHRRHKTNDNKHLLLS